MAPKKTDVSSRRLALTGRLVLIVLLLAGSPASGMRAAEAAGSAVTAAARPPSAAEAHERIEALRAEIAHHDELYFKQSAPVISDQAYDQLKRELAALEQAFPVLAREGVAPAGVGDDRAGAFSSYRHRVRMLSLSKSYTEAELRAFDARLMRQLGRRDLVYVVEPKFDGLAISVTYENGRLVRAVTRGNGTEGDDVTANVLTIRMLPRSLQATAADGTANPIPALIELRGEIFISYPEFARLNAEREKAGELPYATPRNLASGSLKEHDPQEAARRRLEIVFYGRGACEPAAARPDSQQALLRQLHAWGLPTVEAPRVVRGADAMWRAVQALGRERAGFRFPTDGAVVKLDEVALQDKVGVNEQAPLWAMAFKFTAPFVETQLRAITCRSGGPACSRRWRKLSRCYSVGPPWGGPHSTTATRLSGGIFARVILCTWKKPARSSRRSPASISRGAARNQNRTSFRRIARRAGPGCSIWPARRRCTVPTTTARPKCGGAWNISPRPVASGSPGSGRRWWTSSSSGAG